MIKKIFLVTLTIVIFAKSNAQIDIIIGTGTSSNGTSSYPAPYGNFFESSRHQILITASELYALAIPGNVITSLAFQVDVPPPDPLLNVTLKMGHTALGNISNFSTGLTTVHTAGSYTISTGWNTHNFSSNFIWNGVDNILVEFCFDNTDWDDNAMMFFTPVAFNAVIWNRMDGQNMCSNNTTDGTSMDRPNIKLAVLPSGNYNLMPYKLLAPVSGCFLEDSVKVRVYNFGTNDTSNFNLSYSIDGATPVTEFVSQTIQANNYIDYTFSTALTYLGGGPYGINVYTTFAPDTVNDNDTLFATLTQSAISITAPFLETFDALADNQTNNLANGWSITSSGVGNFTWFTETTTTNSSGTGPNSDHTTGNGTYLFTEASNGNFGNETSLITPCIDISSLSAPRLSFWYHKFGSAMGNLAIDIEYKGEWVNNVHIINGQTHSSNAAAWLQADINLISYAGTNIRVRFRGIRGNDFQGDMAIDDVSIYEPASQDIQVVNILSQELGCGLNANDTIVVMLENKGSNPIDSLNLGFRINGNTIASEVIYPSLPAGDTLIYYFSTPADLSIGGIIQIKVFANLVGDPNNFNDSLTKNVSSENSITAPFLETFDIINDNQTGSLTNGWVAGNSLFAWRSEKTTTPSFGTGPSKDNTSGTGTYMYTEANNGIFGSVAELYSPCIDLTPVNNPFLSFWYHKFGSNMGDLMVDVYDGDKWTNNLVVISGQTHTASADLWLKQTISLIPFKGKNIKIRFRGIRANGTLGDMAIDDVRIYDALAKNAILNYINSPSSACGLSASETIEIEFVNAGYDTIQSIDAYYSLDGNTAIIETINATILPDSTFTYSFSTPANLSIIGAYELKVYLDLAGDENRLNDTISLVLQNFLSPQNPIITNSINVCRGNTATLNAISNGLILWYNTPTSNTPIDTGKTFVTDTLYSNRTFYAQAIMGDTFRLGLNPIMNSNSGYTNAGGLKFDVENTAGVIIESIDINANTNGIVSLSIWTSNNVELFTNTYSVNAGVNTLPIVAFVPTGTNYIMRLKNESAGGLQRDNNVTFPFSIPNEITITDGTNSGKYYFFYNWKIKKVQCTSARVSFLQVVGNIPVNLGNDTLICNSQSLTLDAGQDLGYNYVWSFDSTLSTNEILINGSNYQNDTTLSIRVDVIDVANNCSGFDNILVFINNCNGIDDEFFKHVHIYPNPASKELFINLDKFEGTDVTFELIDAQGKIVLLEKNNSIKNTKLDISNTISGIYFLRLYSDNKVKNYKVIIE